MVEDTMCCDAIELSCGTNEGGFIMAMGEFPTDAILKYLRLYCKYNSAIKFLLRHFIIPFIKLKQPLQEPVDYPSGSICRLPGWRCRVRYFGLTEMGHLRSPTFKGLI